MRMTLQHFQYFDIIPLALLEGHPGLSFCFCFCFISEWHFYKKILERFQNCMKLVESVRKSGSVFEASHKSVVSPEVSFLVF